MECYCYLRNIQDLLMGTHHMKGSSENHQRTSYPVWTNGRLSPYLCEGRIEITSIWSKSLAKNIPRLCLVRGWHLEKRHYDRTH